MNFYALDCANISSQADFWTLYLETVKPEGAQYFGCNLDALWDAFSDGGPGWPGACQIDLMNVSSLQAINDGKFYLNLQSLARELEQLTPSAEVFLKFPVK